MTKPYPDMHDDRTLTSLWEQLPLERRLQLHITANAFIWWNVNQVRDLTYAMPSVIGHETTPDRPPESLTPLHWQKWAITQLADEYLHPVAYNKRRMVAHVMLGGAPHHYQATPTSPHVLSVYIAWDVNNYLRPTHQDIIVPRPLFESIQE